FRQRGRQDQPQHSAGDLPGCRGVLRGHRQAGVRQVAQRSGADPVRSRALARRSARLAGQVDHRISRQARCRRCEDRPGQLRQGLQQGRLIDLILVDRFEARFARAFFFGLDAPTSVSPLMVRRCSCAVSNHEATVRALSFETLAGASSSGRGSSFTEELMTASATFSFDAPGDAQRAAELKRVKAQATLVLAGTLTLFAVAKALLHLHPAFGFIAAFAEAATIGGLADWYAVVALFKRPLGLPIPHTAMKPKAGCRCNSAL